MPDAILFGSIGVLAETSELQRRAFNHAFAEAGLGWQWDEDEYRSLLTSSGGKDRIARYAEQTGDKVDARSIHAAKSAHFQGLLRSEGASPRPGVAETLRAAKRAAFVTTTSPDNIAAVLNALSEALAPRSFEVIIDATQVAAPKPAPDAYHLALSRLGLTQDEVIAIEDNPAGAEAARGAQVPVVAFPGAMHVDHDFGAVTACLTRLSPSEPALAA